MKKIRNSLIDKEDFLRISNLNTFVARLLMYFISFNKFNKFYSQNIDKHGVDYINALISQLELKFEFNEDELKHIPQQGAFITISNNPFGGIDGLLLLKLIANIRGDYKLFSNFLLQRFEPLKEQILLINPFENGIDSKTYKHGIEIASEHLKNNFALGIFPAGEVSWYDAESNSVIDSQWQPSVLKFIKQQHVPVVPIYFQGSNSKFFHFLGSIHPALRMVRLPAELFNKKNKIIRIRIGSPITVKEQDGFSDISKYGRYLRLKTYALGTTTEVKKFFIWRPGSRIKKAQKIVSPISTEILKNELNKLYDDYLLFKNQNYSVFCSPAIIIPNILYEIGRLRELTFREVGEGTNRSIDIDEFDLYYHQLFIWDEEKECIVGAYRVGKGKDIMHEYGIDGFYIKTLFKIKKAFYPVIEQSLELGRSFIVKEYQKKPLPLFLLWKGILYFLLKHTEYRYLLGPVSISGEFSDLSKELITKFIMSNYYNYNLAKNIIPRKRFKLKNNTIDLQIFIESAINDKNKLERLDKFIEDIEPENYKLPVLLKRYLKLNGKIIGFNIDPKFNNCLDGLLILDLFDVPVNIIESLSKEINDESILERFYKTTFSDI